MISHITSILNSGALWAVVMIILSALPKINKIIEAHLKTKKATRRNAHELSLMREVDRIIPLVMKIADASPSDRLNEMLSELAQYASKRNIPVTESMLRGFINAGLVRFKNSGGHIAKPIHVDINPNGTVKEDAK